MNDSSNLTGSPHSMEEGIRDLLCNARKSIRMQQAKCENHARESPGCALLGAVAAGYLLHRLPLRAILLTNVRIVAALAPPALILFGTARIIDFLHTHKPDDVNEDALG